MQAKDISAERIFKIIRAAQPSWATLLLIEEAMPEIPRKILLAKLRSLIRQRAITGCACGCRGEFEMAIHAVALEQVGQTIFVR